MIIWSVVRGISRCKAAFWNKATGAGNSQKISQQQDSYPRYAISLLFVAKFEAILHNWPAMAEHYYKQTE